MRCLFHQRILDGARIYENDVFFHLQWILWSPVRLKHAWTSSNGEKNKKGSNCTTNSVDQTEPRGQSKWIWGLRVVICPCTMNEIGIGNYFFLFTFATAVNVYVDDCRCTLRCIIRYPCTWWPCRCNVAIVVISETQETPCSRNTIITPVFSHGKIMFLEFSHWISMCPILLTGCIPVPVFPVKTTVIYSRPCIIFIIQWFTISCGLGATLATHHSFAH